MKVVQKEIKELIRKGKHKYELKLESKLQAYNMKDVWDGMKKITSYITTTSDEGRDRAFFLPNFVGSNW